MKPTESGCGFRFGSVLLLSSVCTFPGLAAAEGVPTLQSDFGGVGLMQTPTARMEEVGEFSVTYSTVEPYTRIAVSLQPLEWLEVGFRYTSINNRKFGKPHSDRDYLDKGVDVKFRLVEEGQYMPAIAIGFRDFGGTGFFSSEYIVFSKRWYNFDFSLGIATGYIGAGGSIDNPLGYISDHFDKRKSGSDSTGEFALDQLFTGDLGFFGGVAWQTPWDPLVIMVEYDGNDYQSEPLNNDQEQDSPINIGASYRVNDYLVLAAGWERGNTAMLRASLNINLADFKQPKADPPPVPLKRNVSDRMPDNWAAITRKLQRNAGIDTSRILRKGNTLIVEGVATKYRSLPETELRASRILHNHLPAGITQFKYRWEKAGLYLREDTLPRAPLPREPFIADSRTQFVEQDYRQDVYSRGMSGALARREGGRVLYEDGWRGFSYQFSPGLSLNYGGPDGFLYSVLVQLDARLWTDENGFFSGTLGYNLIGNFEDYEYLEPTQLPRVRTYIGEYLQQVELGVYNLQYTRTARLSENLFAMAYAGLLEMMYGGVGGEILYRPFNSPIAVGLDVNWVRQRGFDVLFDFRDYDTVTGHLTLYWETGFKDILAKFRFGRYLARDWGVTVNLSRRFESGVRIGAWATFTDVGEAYGEGSFDKGLYVRIPWDFFFTESSRNYVKAVWDPLTRDGGAILNRKYTLYRMTNGRDLGPYWHNFQDTQ